MPTLEETLAGAMVEVDLGQLFDYMIEIHDVAARRGIADSASGSPLRRELLRCAAIALHPQCMDAVEHATAAERDALQKGILARVLYLGENAVSDSARASFRDPMAWEIGTRVEISNSREFFLAVAYLAAAVESQDSSRPAPPKRERRSTHNGRGT